MSVEIIRGPGGIYWIGDWTFDADDDADLEYIDEAIEAWTAWKAHVISNFMPQSAYIEGDME